MKNLKKIKSGNFDKLMLSNSKEINEIYLDVEISEDLYVKILEELTKLEVNVETIEQVLNKNNIQVAYKTCTKIGIKPIILAYNYTDYLGNVKKQHELVDCQFKYQPVVQSGKPSLALFIKFLHHNEIFYIDKAIILDTEEDLQSLLDIIENETIYIEKVKTNFDVKLLNHNFTISEFLR